MSLIEDLEERFKRINAKLESNSMTNSIEETYQTECARINQIEFVEEIYANGLNECRDEMLHQLITKRNEQLKEVNGFIENMESNQQQDSLNDMAKSVKAKNISFACSLISVRDSISNATKFKNYLDFSKLILYSIFTRIIKPWPYDGLKEFNNIKYFRIAEKISANLVFVTYAANDGKYSGHMAIIRSNGEIAHHKKFQPNQKVLIETNSLNTIGVFIRNENLVELYDYKFEMKHSFKLERHYDLFMLRNFEIVFFDEGRCDIALINSKTKQLKRQNISFENLKAGENVLKEILDFDLFDINENHIFLSNGYRLSCDMTIHVFDRNCLSFMYTIYTVDMQFGSSVWCNYDSELYLIEDYNKVFEISRIGTQLDTPIIITVSSKYYGPWSTLSNGLMYKDKKIFTSSIF
jgi:hypothetical protein